jgi:ubiquitin carboxyl-terminal hydrolase 5/13
MSSLSSARQSEVKAWEEEIEACEHTVMLEQVASPQVAEAGHAQCSFDPCGLKENLWLCLTCGNLACGRQQYGGGPAGNGHALLHYNETGHGPAVKLGTITSEGTADVYCYKCDDSKLDLELATHLATFGINVLTQLKTEKTMTELVSWILSLIKSIAL